MTNLRINKRTFIAAILTALLATAGCQSGQGTNEQAGKETAPVAVQPAAGDSSSNANAGQAGAGTEQSQGDTGSKAPSANNAYMGKVTALRLIDTKSGWAAGDGWIARTDNGGEKWEVQYLGSGTFKQLFALNGKEAWASVGETGTLLTTSDGGKHWTPAGKVPNNGFLHFVSKTEALSANARTTDGGKSWSTLPVPEQMVGEPYFHDSKNGWAVTQSKDKIEVKRTQDGGKTWNTVMSKNTAAALTNALIRSAGADDAWVECIGSSGMTQTSYSLFHTADGGKQWQTVIAHASAGGGPAPGFPADYTGGPTNTGSAPGTLYVASPKVAVMGGVCSACDKPNTVGWTADGGKTWVNGKDAFEGFGEQLLGVSDANHAWLICTDNAAPSVMYTTSDAGKHWKKAYTFEKPKSK